MEAAVARCLLAKQAFDLFEDQEVRSPFGEGASSANEDYYWSEPRHYPPLRQVLPGSIPTGIHIERRSVVFSTTSAGGLGLCHLHNYQNPDINGVDHTQMRKSKLEQYLHNDLFRGILWGFRGRGSSSVGETCH